MSDELDDAMLENAKGPKRAQDDAGSVEQHSIQDQIALANYRQAKVNQTRRTFPGKILKLVPPGAVGE